MADQGGEGLLSPFLRTRRLEAAKPFLQGRVLDVGCGTGYLADFVPADQYAGVDVDEGSLQAARLRHPHHRFLSELPPRGTTFNTVVALAVIEHAPDPLEFLEALSARLDPAPGSRIICTTPHPLFDGVHRAGAAMGLFSFHAREEHQQLLGHWELLSLAGKCRLSIALYRRFLLGANQLLVLKRRQ